MEMSEGGKVSVLVLDKERCRKLQGRNTLNWSLVCSSKVNQNDFKIRGFQQSCHQGAGGSLLCFFFQIECAPLKHYLPWCLLLLFILKYN